MDPHRKLASAMCLAAMKTAEYKGTDRKLVIAANRARLWLKGEVQGKVSARTCFEMTGVDMDAAIDRLQAKGLLDLKQVPPKPEKK